MSERIKEEVQIISEHKGDDNICELEHLRKLFIGGLASYTTEENLKNFYGQWGNVVDVVVMRDTTTKRSRGFGFITYTKSYMVDKAQENRPHIIDGKSVEAKRALPRPERESADNKNVSVKKLFVGGLKDNHDEECLREYFGQFGNVISVKILIDRNTGKRRGFAFIEFDDYDAVDKAILHRTHSIKYVVVDVKKSLYGQELQKKNVQKQTSMNNMNDVASRQNMPNTVNMQRPPIQPPQQITQYPPQGTMNYNQWGMPPPGVAQQNYPGYQSQPPMNPGNWNYPGPNAWNTPPPNTQAPQMTWQGNQWCGPPPLAGPMPTNGSMQNWQQQPPPMPAVPGGPVQQQPQQQPQQQIPTNFGTGYQQNYGGGPVKQNSMNSNRINPYNGGPPANNSYNNVQLSQQHQQTSGYGYSTGAASLGVSGVNNELNKQPPSGNVSKGTLTNGNSSTNNGGGKYRR